MDLAQASSIQAWTQQGWQGAATLQASYFELQAITAMLASSSQEAPGCPGCVTLCITVQLKRYARACCGPHLVCIMQMTVM
jgi:hypothetical protein